MIHCARCHQQTAPGAPCAACGHAPALDGRYELLAMLGHGASGITWRARRLADAATVAIKEINFRRLAGLKTLELFERETRILQHLAHPGIPSYLEDFTVEDGRDISLYLVQECIDGHSLQPGAQAWDEAAIFGLLRQIARVLEYLYERRPPVVHRDIKPSNIMRRQDGRYVLIDFGAIAIARQGQGGSTVAGTFGYMAPEQFRGLASAASDIYGLGATALVRAAAARAEVAPAAPSQPSRAPARTRAISEIAADYWLTWARDVSASLKSARSWSAGATLGIYSVMLGLGCTTAFLETLFDAQLLYALFSRFDSLSATGKMLVMLAPGAAALTLVWGTYFRYRRPPVVDTWGERDYNRYRVQRFLRELVEPDVSSRLGTGWRLGALSGAISLGAVLLMVTILPTHIYLGYLALCLLGLTGICWALAPICGWVYRQRLTWQRLFFQVDEVWAEDAERCLFKQAARLFGRANPGDNDLRRGRELLARLPARTPAQQVQLSTIHLLDSDRVGTRLWLDALEVIRAQKPAPWRDRLLHEVAMRIYPTNKARARELLGEVEHNTRLPA